MVICEKLITTPNEKLKKFIKKLCISWSRVNCIRLELRARLKWIYETIYYLFFLLFVGLKWVT